MQHHVTVKPLPFFYVGQKATAERITRFQNQKHNVLSQALGKPDTKSVWYSKEHFVKLLEEIEYAGGDGIRINFGMYEDGHQYAGQLCLLFNVTREKTIGNTTVHGNVVLEKEPNYTERSSQPKEIILFPGDDPTEDEKDFNLGLPCPPRCDDSDSIYS
jgi:hypothetical protein